MHKAKKSLGQNFLKSADALRKIILAGEIGPNDTILEIGPGKGALTEKILENAEKVIAIEKDRDLLAFLREKFSLEVQKGKLILEEGDILELKTGNLPEKYKIIANIPYNITGAILKMFLTSVNQPESMILMVQNEVAKRIVASDGKESILSISVKAYGVPKIVTKVPARYFSPAPKVDSAVISIKNISRDTFSKKKQENIDENRFWEVVKAGFAHKRKILLKNLKNLDKKTNWEEIFQKLELKNNTRAEDLSLKDWIELSKGH